METDYSCILVNHIQIVFCRFLISESCFSPLDLCLVLSNIITWYKIFLKVFQVKIIT